jgi:hypothetical protein
MIAHFSSIRQGPHRKQRLKRLFVAAGTSVTSYLATIGAYTHRHMRQILLLRVFVATRTCLPSSCLQICFSLSNFIVTSRYRLTHNFILYERMGRFCLETIQEYTHTHGLIGIVKYAIEMGSGAMMYIPSFYILVQALKA